MGNLLNEVIYSSTIYIAEEMGVALQNTAYSPNIRDRKDLSCAVFSGEGELVAQAEHIPVHLGSMMVGVKNTLEYLEKHDIKLCKNDVIIVNDPYIAGTHLNDVMLLAPIYHNNDIIGFVANKAHHVDVGGIIPGSIGSVEDLYSEGLVLPPIKIVDKGKLVVELIKFICSNVRVPRYTVGDLKAQIAAINIGIKGVMELLFRYGKKRVSESWKWAIEYSKSYTYHCLSEMPNGSVESVDYIEINDKILNINISVNLRGKKIDIDFSGTHKQVNYPINAVYGVTVAASSYAFKSIVDPNLPMNSGFYRTINIEAPKKTIVNPVKPAPVSMGNLETSQRIVDVIYRALSKIVPDRVPAGSHGSMNNIVFGGKIDNEGKWAFYETIGGGGGARFGLDGVDGVHVNMTNTLNTPVEVIEREYPIMILEYSLIPDSGGPGKYRGGLGIRRVYKILEDDVTLSIACERVKTRPWGIQGGLPGKNGEHYIISKDKKIRLNSKDTVILRRGDIVVINTPGGGGYGDPKLRDFKHIKMDLEEGKISDEHATQFYNLK